MRYCLIGERLPYSFSKVVHNLMGLDFSLNELNINELPAFVKGGEYNGFNVTIPYKTEIIKYLDGVDPLAKEIGAVNTVVNKNGKLYGYNTDIFGMELSFDKMGVSLKDKVVLILGTGGTSKTANTLCKKLGASKVYKVSRSGEINYDNCYDIDGVEVIINTTPVGTYPNNFDRAVDLEKFPNLKAVFDVVYNPIKSSLVLQAESLNIPCLGGLYMLVSQAIGAESLWLGKDIDRKVIDKIYGDILKEKQNVVLEGMPSSGKSSIGIELSKRLNKTFIDTDLLIEEKTGKKPSEIICESGESTFREIESEVVKQASKNNSCIIALGGGVPLREENRKALKQNGIIVYIKRDLALLVSDDRPISQKEGVKALYEKRKDIYENFADFIVENNGDIDSAIKEIENLWKY